MFTSLLLNFFFKIFIVFSTSYKYLLKNAVKLLLFTWGEDGFNFYDFAQDKKLLIHIMKILLFLKDCRIKL